MASILFLTATIAAFLLTNYAYAADSISNISTSDDNTTKETEDKIKALEEKAKTYQQIIDIKQKQQASLSNQISLIEAEEQKIQAEIAANKGRIEDLNKKISTLQVQVDEKSDTINLQKKILSDLFQVYYEYNQKSDVSIFYELEKLSKISSSNNDRILQTVEKMKEILSNISSLKRKLDTEMKDLESEREEIANLNMKQQEKSTELASTKDKKEFLITQTKGEESRYQNLLARVEMQKMELLGDIDELYTTNTEEINKILAGLDKPRSGLASMSWYYSQKDSSWGNMTIGQSNSLVKDYGCALTSVAMIFTYYGDRTTPANLAKQRIFYWDLIVWPDGTNAVLADNTSHSGVNWSEIDSELDLLHPVIVFIKAKASGAGHYIVIHHKVGSRYIVHDPYFGPNIYLDSSIMLLSSLYKTSISKGSIDQMILYNRKP